MDNLSLADIKALDNDNNMGGSWWFLILFVLLFMGRGAGFGNYGFGGNEGGLATAGQVYDATNQQSVFNALSSIKETVNAGIYEAGQNTNTIVSQITALGNQMQQCCCDLKTQMLQDKYDDVRYQLEQANTAVANAVQTQNILGNLGRYVTNPPSFPNVGPFYGNYNGYGGTTIA